MKNEKDLQKLIEDKNVLYIATKNKDYIRVQQEIEFISMFAEKYDIITYSDKSYKKRFVKCLFKSLVSKTNKYDVIFIGFMAQMILPWIGWKWKNKIIISDIFISIYDTLVDDRKKVKPNSCIAMFVKKIDELTIKKSNFIVTDTINHGEYFVKNLGAENEKCYVIYLKADQSIYYPKKVSKPESLKDKFIVVYFGSILPVQGVEVVLEAIDLLKNIKKIHFIMIGPIRNKYQKIESNTVTYYEWLSQKELSDCIAFADLCLGGHFSKDIGKAKRTIPGKVYIYKAMDKKVILGNSSANHELYDESNNNYYVELGDSQQLAKCIFNTFEKSEIGD